MAQPAVLVLVRDLFFRLPIQDGLRLHGYQSLFAQSTAQFAEALAQESPELAIVSLEVEGPPTGSGHRSGQAVDWEACIRQAHAAGVPVLAFGPHDDLEARARALAAGAQAVYAKAKFITDLPALVARHVARVAP